MNPKLRIREVERITLDVPFTARCQPWNSLLVLQWRVSEIIRIVTDTPDIVGYGETLPHYTWGRVSDASIEKVRGGNPFDFLGDDSLGAGLQMALYDAAGKAAGVPVYRLLNLPKVRDWCPIAWWNTKMPPEALAEEAQDALAQGYTAHKFKARPWFDVFEQVEAVSAVTPPHYHLDLDWNDMLLNAGNAIPILTRLDEYERISIYEGVISAQDVEGYRKIRQHVKHPLAIHFGNPPFHIALREEMCDGFVVGGGVAGVLRQGSLAAAFNKPFWLQLVGTGLTTALSAHLGAVLTHAQWPAISCLNNYTDDVLAEPLVISGGYVRVPEGPGLGVVVDEGALARYRMTPPYELPQPRHILTVRWPGGQRVHFASMQACWTAFQAGNLRPGEPGVRMDISPDDSSAEWAALYARAATAPVHEG